MGTDENTPMEGAEGAAGGPAEGAAPPPPPPPPAPMTPPPAPPMGGPAPAPAGGQPKDKTVAGILGILLGSFGAHKFYLGYQNEAIIMLAVTLGGYILGFIGSFIVVGACLFVAPMVMGVIGLIEGIMYLTKTDQDFYNTYVANKKAWF